LKSAEIQELDARAREIAELSARARERGRRKDVIKPETLKIQIGKFVLKGEKVGGKWTLTCKRWPDLAEKFSGGESAVEAIEEFTRRAMELAVVVKNLAAHGVETK
jgi:hypothetical protein